MEASVLNIKGQDTGRKVVLNDAIYAIEPNDHAIYLDVKLIMANKRQGTAKTKERSEMSGSTRKLGRQNGFKLNKKVRQLARCSALAYKAQENAIVVVEDFTFETPKTKSMLEVLNNLNIAGKKALVVTPASDKGVYLSARNLQRVATMPAAALNTYQVLNADVMVVAESALAVIEGNLTK